jgi:hypothetical protein
MLKIQSVRATLGQVDESKAPDSEQIHKVPGRRRCEFEGGVGYKKP